MISDAEGNRKVLFFLGQTECARWVYFFFLGETECARWVPPALPLEMPGTSGNGICSPQAAGV